MEVCSQMKPFLQSDFTPIHHPTRSHDSSEWELQVSHSNFCDTALHRSQCSFPFVLFSLNYTALKMVEPMGVEPTICLLAKQMPLPHSSHGPIENVYQRFSDAFSFVVSHPQTSTAVIASLGYWIR